MIRTLPLACLTIMLCYSLLASTPAHARTMSIATGNPSGTYYPFGGGLASIWSKYIADFNMKAEVTGASVTNIIQVAKGESETAMTQADVAIDAAQGTGKFPEKLAVSAMHTLYPNLVHLVTPANSGIEHIDDIRGRKVSIGAPGSGNATATLKILGALGIDPSEFTVRNLNYTETATSLKDGHLDAGFIVGGINSAVMMELSLTRNVRLVPFSASEITKINTLHPAFTAFEVPVGTYKGVDKPVQVASLWNVLMVSNTLSDDTVYEMIKATFEHRDALVQISPVARYLTLENALKLPNIPLHPGAIRYFAEAGMYPPEYP